MRLEDRDAVDLGPSPDELAEEIRYYEQRRQYERDEVARASAVARRRLEEDAALRRRAETDAEAAMELLQRVFRRYNAAMVDGTEGEKQGWREEVSKACAQYNRLTGRHVEAA